MSNGKETIKSIFSRKGVPKNIKDAPGYTKSIYKENRKGRGWDAFYGIDRGLDKHLPELFAVDGQNKKVFDLAKYFALARPQVQTYHGGMMAMAIDYMGAGFLYPWTLMQFSVQNCVWSTFMNYHRLNRVISITRDNFRTFLEDYREIFPDEITAAVTALIDPNGPAKFKELWNRMQLSSAAQKPPPGGPGIFSAWPESRILFFLRKGIGRDDFLSWVVKDVADLAEAGAHFALTERQVEQQMQMAEMKYAKEQRLLKAQALKQLYLEKYKPHQLTQKEGAFQPASADDEDDTDGPARKRRR